MRKLGLILGAGLLLVVVLCGARIFTRPERGTTGSVNTKFRLFGSDDKIVVDGFDDPKVEGVACHISRAQTGGMNRVRESRLPGFVRAKVDRQPREGPQARLMIRG